MNAIRKLTFVKKYTWRKKEYIKFDLPAETSLSQMQEQHRNFDSFKHLDLSREYGGFIRASLISKKCNDEEMCPIYKLLLEIKNANQNGNVLEGHALSMDENKEEITLVSWDNNISENKEMNGSIINSPSNIRNTFSRLGEWKMINVGHGLSIVNYISGVIYDAGGKTAHYNNWLKEVDKIKGKITFIISHAHLDHYNYLEKYIKQGNAHKIKNIIFNINSSFDRRSSRRIFNLNRKIGIPIKKLFTTSYFEIFCNFKKLKNENDNSLLLRDSGILFTGDQRYENFIGESSFIGVSSLQVPHHGSFGAQTGIPPKSSYGIKTYVSVGGKYGLPASNITTKFPGVVITKDNPSKKVFTIK